MLVPTCWSLERSSFGRRSPHGAVSFRRQSAWRSLGSDRVREAVALLDQRGVDFEYDGEMAADVALSCEARRLYPFCRLSDVANVLVMAAFHSASISTKMLKELGGATLIGPLLVGLTHPVQICPLGAMDTDIENLPALAAYDIGG